MGKKSSNIQMLRIALIIMVIILHYNLEDSGGALKYSMEGNTYLAVKLFESLSICAVNVFIVISGYFSIEKEQRKIGKVLSLFCWVIFYRAFFSFIKMLFQGDFNIRVLVRHCFPINYYVYLYSALYCISPFLNKSVCNFDKNQFKKLLIILLLLFSVEPTITDALCDVTHMELAGISTISLGGSQEGYTIVNFLLLYLIGCYLKKYELAPNNKKTSIFYFILYILMSVCIWIFSLISETAWNYCNILVVLQAIFLFMSFATISISFSRIIDFIAASVYGVFLIHGTILTFLTEYTNTALKVQGFGSLFMNMALVVSLCFIICVVIDSLIRFLIAPIAKKWKKTKIYCFKI